MEFKHFSVYLDEFGHVGPYLGADHPRHNDHPAFGLAGIAIPTNKVRGFSTFFYQLKGKLLKYDIDKALKKQGLPEYRFEKKGAALYTVQNVSKYRQLRQNTFRILNQLNKIGAFVFYVGQEKRRDLASYCPKREYKHILKEALKRLDDEFASQGATYQLILDEHQERIDIFTTVAIEMFGPTKRQTLIEPPYEADSQLYQTVQMADWICGLVGRLAFYQCDPEAKPEFKIFDTYFKERLSGVQKRSSIRNFSRPSEKKLRQLVEKYEP